MCNCGKKRAQIRTSVATGVKLQTLTASRSLKKEEPILFEYTGTTALSLIGKITKKNYRFGFPGDRQYIELKDVPSLTAVPVLKQISS